MNRSSITVGKPSSFYLELDPDWAPSLKLGYGPSNPTVSDRYNWFQSRAKKRRVEVEDNPEPSNISDLNDTSELPSFFPVLLYTSTSSKQ